MKNLLFLILLFCSSIVIAKGPVVIGDWNFDCKVHSYDKIDNNLTPIYEFKIRKDNKSRVGYSLILVLEGDIPGEYTDYKISGGRYKIFKDGRTQFETIDYSDVSADASSKKIAKVIIFPNKKDENASLYIPDPTGNGNVYGYYGQCK